MDTAELSVYDVNRLAGALRRRGVRSAQVQVEPVHRVVIRDRRGLPTGKMMDRYPVVLLASATGENDEDGQPTYFVSWDEGIVHMTEWGMRFRDNGEVLPWQ